MITFDVLLFSIPGSTIHRKPVSFGAEFYFFLSIQVPSFIYLTIHAHRLQNLPKRIFAFRICQQDYYQLPLSDLNYIRFELYYSAQVCFMNKGHMILPALPYYRRICRWTRIVTTSLKSACSSCVIIVSDDHYTSWKSFKKPVSKHRFSSKQKHPILSVRR